VAGREVGLVVGVGMIVVGSWLSDFFTVFLAAKLDKLKVTPSQPQGPLPTLVEMTMGQLTSFDLVQLYPVATDLHVA